MPDFDAIDEATLAFLSSLRILCVDDNSTTQLLYGVFLENIVEEVLFASDGKEALELFSSHDVDIIFTDYDMPMCNGLEFIQRVREGDREIPVILASSIEDVSIIAKALNFDINYFLQKPLEQKTVRGVLIKASKILMAYNYLQEQNSKHEYMRYQEDLAFAKELNILRNDFYYQMRGEKSFLLIDFLYKPLDVVSGDAYSVRRIDENRSFYLLVDGMGKGVSASLSAMLITTYINHLIDKMLKSNSFSLDSIIKESMEYIQSILLDEEALAIDYILFDDACETLHYAKFAMPVFLLENSDGKIIKIKSNNPPLSKWQTSFTVDICKIDNVLKFLFYSDGIVENSTVEDDKTYAEFIEDDFKNSFTREEFKDKVYEKIVTQEDDLTLIFIHKLCYKNAFVTETSIDSRLASLEEADVWYSDIWAKLDAEKKLNPKANIVFTELLMNAYEHGNLGVSAKEKHKLLEEDIYLETLQRKEQVCDKKIHIKVEEIRHRESRYIITQIRDEGEGFDIQTLSYIFRNSKSFNGRGVLVSRKNSMGIYYNAEGNSVLFLNKI